ncbi:MAG TPA: DUF4350 domain-containing protein [Thermoanaerobaculia bacterium]|nr:DUF4350 domain-containing protein [Thermoanaerobaculia bacterium]
MPLVGVAVAFVLAGVIWIAGDRRASLRVYDDYSTANTSEGGLSLASRYLARSGRRVRMLTHALDARPIEANAVLFRVSAELPVFFDVSEFDEIGPRNRRRDTPLLSDPEEAFVRRGGRLVIVSPTTAGTLELRGDTQRTAKKVFPLGDGIDTFDVPESAKGFTSKSLPPRAIALYESGDAVIAARERIGRGETFLVSVPDLFTNESLAKRGHLALLTMLAGSGRPVYFDEVIHGIASDDGALSILKEWNLGPLLLLLAAIAFVDFWRHGKRVGPADDEERDRRSDAVDLVDSLGALYRRATNDVESIALYRDALTRTVALQTGLRGDALQKRVATLCERGGADFAHQLATINEAFRRLSGGKH